MDEVHAFVDHWVHVAAMIKLGVWGYLVFTAVVGGATIWMTARPRTKSPRKVRR